LQWFHDKVFPKILLQQDFHIAGTITYHSDLCTCTKVSRIPEKSSQTQESPDDPNESKELYHEYMRDSYSCKSHEVNVHCHGPLPESELNNLIENSLVTINPVLDTTGVATKTCQSLALGTPMVVTEFDGTFHEKSFLDRYSQRKQNSNNLAKDSIGGDDDDSNKSNGDDENNIISSKNGALFCRHLDENCFTSSLQSLLFDPDEWQEASKAGQDYIASSYGMGQYMRDWVYVFEQLLVQRINIVIDGDAKTNGESMAAQNWHIANTLKAYRNFHVTVMGELDPSIPGVDRVDVPSSQAIKLDNNKLHGVLPGHQTYETPFPTGYQADIIIRQKWPPSIHSLPLSFCGGGCRVAQILPWEYGVLPLKWIPQLSIFVDELWAPSQYNRNIFHASGIEESRTKVVSAGIDCEGLLLKSKKNQSNNNNGNDEKNDASNKIRFLFSGGFIPRKGIDIMLEVWSTEFCTNRNAQLVLHTSYELGYGDNEMSNMQDIIDRCNNIEWIKNKWLSDEEHVDLINSVDIYLAPFRSEGFGLPIAEALAMGLSIVVSTGGTSVDDFIIGDLNNAHSSKIYPVAVVAETCIHEPCEGDKLCVFLPCKKRKFHKEHRCTCERLIEPPSWFEPNRHDLQSQMVQALEDNQKKKINKEANDLIKELGNSIKSFKVCWSNLKSLYHKEVSSSLESGRKRELQKFIVYKPKDRLNFDLRRRIKNCVMCFVIVGVSFFARILYMSSKAFSGKRKKI